MVFDLRYLRMYLVRISNDPTKYRIPNVQIIGIGKCGTTSLASYMADNMPTCFGKVTFHSTGKEAHYFQEYTINKQYNVQYYESLYEHCSLSRYIVDASPSTVRYPERVYEFYKEHSLLMNDPTILSNLKIILIIRDPVDREISFYNFRIQVLKKDKKLYPSFLQPKRDETFPLVKNGTNGYLSLNDVLQRTIIPALTDRTTTMISNNSTATTNDNINKNSTYSANTNVLYRTYVDDLKEWVKYYDRKQILVLSFDELAKEPIALQKRIHEFLDVPLIDNDGTIKSIQHENPTQRRQSYPQKNKKILLQSFVQEKKKKKTTNDDDSINNITNNQTRTIETNSTITTSTTTTTTTETCVTLYELQRLFEVSNQELYNWLDNNPGPSMEQRPFPKFHYKIKDC